MKRPYQITAVVFVLFSAFVVRESVALKFYSSLGPGPGFFPFWIGLLVGALALSMFCHSTWGGEGREPMPSDFFASKAAYLRMFAITVAMIAVVVLMESVGFRPIMFAFMVFLLLALGRESLILTILVAGATSFGLYHAFVQWLKIPLPVGILGI